MNRKCDLVDVSTHSRPKAAGQSRFEHGYHLFVSTHSRPKAAGIRLTTNTVTTIVSTHSRPKAAGQNQCCRLTE